MHGKMMVFCTNVILLLFFSLIVILSVKGKKSTINALIIFHSLNAVKIVFLCVWAIHKTGTIDLNYLQFPDEYYYLAESHIGGAVSNLYHLLVYGMKEIGFSIGSLKMINILVTSFAVVRLYTLRNLVRDKNRYITHLLILGGIFFLHVTYYSIFVLKDALFFYVTVEFLIQLIKRSRNNRWVLMIFLCVILMLIRPPMILGFMVFLFDKNWCIQWKRLLLFFILGAIFIRYGGQYYDYERKFYGYVAAGLSENLHVEGSKGERKEYAQTYLLNDSKAYLRLVLGNIRNTTSIFYQTDITCQLILFLECCTVFYLLIIRKNIVRIIRYWPVLAVAFLYFIFGSLTLYNIRYNLFPMAFLIYLLIFVNSKPLVNFK